VKTRFKKTAPRVTGWYWVSYWGEGCGKVVCPARFLEISKWGDPFEWTVHTIYDAFFYSKRQKDLRFGPEIEMPE